MQSNESTPTRIGYETAAATQIDYEESNCEGLFPGWAVLHEQFKKKANREKWIPTVDLTKEKEVIDLTMDDEEISSVTSTCDYAIQVPVRATNEAIEITYSITFPASVIQDLIASGYGFTNDERDVNMLKKLQHYAYLCYMSNIEIDRTCTQYLACFN